MAIGLSGFPDGVAPEDADGGTRAGRAQLRAAGHSGRAAESAQQAGLHSGGGPQAGRAPAPAQPDSRLLKKSLAQLEPNSQKAMAYFFATLFVRHRELRPMFPLALDAHRERVFTALARYAWTSDRPESLAGWLSELAREHRKFGVKESHYRPFCDALLTALAAFEDGPTPAQTQAAWQGALDHIAAIMAAATRDAQDEPPWWLAEVVGHERRRPGLAVLTLRLDQPMRHRAGQHVSIQVPRWPRVWREYSIANAPAPDGLLRLHVRAVPCGLVSTVLVHQTARGDTLVVGPARGGMTVAAMEVAVMDVDGDFAQPGRQVACFAGGTGLAPIKAIAEELTRTDPNPAAGILLFFGARHEADLYDLPDLRRLSQSCPALTVIPVISGDPGYGGMRGTLAQAAAAHLPPGTHDVFISGPPGMVRATAGVAAARCPGARIHFDPQPGFTVPPEPRARGTNTV